MKYLIIFICITLFSTAFGLKCYQCRGMECSKGDLEIRNCDTRHLLPGYQNACLKLEYMDAMTQHKKVHRKCVIVEMRNDKPFYICPTEEGYPVDCPVCVTDLCNSSSKARISFIIIFGIYVFERIILTF